MIYKVIVAVLVSAMWQVSLGADCDCCYHPGGCSICIPPPQGYKCVCSYKGAWTCGGWAAECGRNEFCPGGESTYCACKQGGGDCWAYGDASRDPNGDKCAFKTPLSSECNCESKTDWNQPNIFTVTNVTFDESKIREDGSHSRVNIEENTKALKLTPTFQYTGGIKPPSGTKFKTVLPLAGSANNSMTGKQTAEYSWPVTGDRTLTYTRKSACPQGKTCKEILLTSQIRIPYTMTLQHNVIKGCRCSSEGVWSGIGSYNHVSLINPSR